jgi:hypothetical protein
VTLGLLAREELFKASLSFSGYKILLICLVYNNFMEQTWGWLRWGWANVRQFVSGLVRGKAVNFDQIDLSPMFPHWGVVYQGGSVDEAMTLPSPIVIVCMNDSEMDEKWVDHKVVYAVLYIGIKDSDDGVLPDDILRGLVDAGIAFLSQGINLYVHCAAGVSRSSYYDIALHCQAMSTGYTKAYQYIKKQRPIIEPNPSFVAQLRRLYPDS